MKDERQKEIDSIKDFRRSSELAIMEILINLQKATGMEVSNLDINSHLFSETGMAGASRVISGVNIELELPR